MTAQQRRRWLAVAVRDESKPGLRARLGAFRRSLTRRERASLAGMAATVLLLHLVGFAVLFVVVAPAHYALGGTTVFTAGVGILAYTFGLRHAFDADHIAAVDNTTRTLLADRAERAARGVPLRPRPLSVGFWFSLGHSTIVFALAFLLAIGVRALAGAVEDSSSTLHEVTGVVGASVSGVFLWLLGLMNLAALIGIVSVCRGLRAGRFDETRLEEQLNKRGFLNRFLGGLTRAVHAPWQIYPIGVLFGLGFDTATEVGLLVLGSGAAATGLPFQAVLVLPVLFAAGMSLMDTADGIFMNAAYGWAFARPARKVFYNLTITSISVAVALIVGTVELVGVIADQAHITSGPLGWLAGLNLDYAGYGIVALFVVAWTAALMVWRFGHLEQKWSARLAPARQSAE